MQEGEQPSFFMVVDGALDVRKIVHGNDRRINTYRTGDYFGELPLLLGAPAIASVRALEPSRVAQLDALTLLSLHRLQALLCRTDGYDDQRFTRLRTIAEETPPSASPLSAIASMSHATTCATFWCATDPVPLAGSDAAVTQRRHRTTSARDTYPIVVLPDGRRLVTPTLRELAEGIGLQTVPRNAVYDLAIIGGGPAGLAAAVYGASEGLSTIIVEREAPGGQAGTSTRIENYLGFPTGLSGDELGGRALQQAQRFGAEILVARDVVGLDAEPMQVERTVLLDDGDRLRARSIVLANGVKWRDLDLPSANALVGRGLFYGAARSEAIGCTGKDVYLVGGGNSAGQAAMYFSNYARRVTLLVRGRSLADSMSHYLIQQLATKDNVEVRTRTRIIRVEGELQLEAIVVENRDTGNTSAEPAFAVFVLIGADAETAWLPRAVICDDKGYVCTGRDVMDLMDNGQASWPLERDPYLLETSVPGVFAAGDVRHGSVKRVASGVGEGSMAIAFVHQYLATVR